MQRTLVGWHGASSLVEGSRPSSTPFSGRSHGLPSSRYTASPSTMAHRSPSAARTLAILMAPSSCLLSAGILAVAVAEDFQCQVGPVGRDRVDAGTVLLGAQTAHRLRVVHRPDAHR